MLLRRSGYLSLLDSSGGFGNSRMRRGKGEKLSIFDVPVMSEGKEVTLLASGGLPVQKSWLAVVGTYNRLTVSAVMVQLTPFGTRGGKPSLNRYDSLSNGNFDDDQTLVGVKH